MILSPLSGLLAAAMLMSLPAGQTSATNLATRDYDAIVLTSSLKDTAEHYSDHLIDGREDTFWHSGTGASERWPHWVELRWKHPQQPQKVVLIPAAGYVLPAQWSVEIWEDHQWKLAPQQTLSEHGDAVSFPPVTSEKLKINLGTGRDPIALKQVRVEGAGWKTLERLRPYWAGKYIWHDEEGHRLQLGKPRYFRRSFQLKEAQKVVSAVVMSRSNDDYVAYLNGKEIAQGNTVITPQQVRQFLRDGENVFAYRATAQSDPGFGQMELIGDLVIYTDGGRDAIGTDRSWHSSTQEEEGWNAPGFQPSADWKTVAEIGAPPEGPWGEIAYPDPGQTFPVELERISIDPQVAAPGERVTLRATLRLRRPIACPFQFEWRVGEQRIHPDLANYSLVSSFVLPSPQVNEWEAGKSYTIEGSIVLPSHSPDGRVPVQLGAVSTDGRHQTLAINGATIREPLAFLKISRPDHPPALEQPNRAAMIRHNQLGILRINDRLLPPVFYGGTMHWSYRAHREYAEAGAKVFELHMPGRITTDEQNEPRGYQVLDELARNLLSTVPDASIIVFAYLRPLTPWLVAHPDAVQLDAFGRPYSESVASGRYQAAVEGFVDRLAQHIKKQDYGNHVVGFHFVMGAQADAYIGGTERNIGEIHRENWTLGDWNLSALEDFRAFLRQRYHDDTAALRRAWKDDSITFESAKPDRAALVHALPDDSLFRNPAKEGMMAPDYCAWISSIIPRMYERTVTRTIEKHFGKEMLVLNWSGYLVQLFASIPPAWLQQNNGFWLQHTNYNVGETVFTGTTHYEARHGGFRATPFQPLDSLARHGKMGMIEIDYRTFVAGPKIHGRQTRQDESIAVLQREMGTALIHGSGYYFLEFVGTGNGRPGVGYFDHESLQETIRTTYREIEQAIAAKKAPEATAEIAVVFSAETPWYQDVAYPGVVYNTLINDTIYRELAGVGAPLDILQMNDLLAGKDLDRYKLILFVNTWYMSPAQRVAVEALKSKGRTLCWMYAPGYVDDERGLSVETMQELTGLNLSLIAGRERPAFRTGNADHPLLKGVGEGTEITIRPLGAGEHFNELMPVEISPNFEINDPEATVIGRDEQGRARFVAKEMEGWKSVYTAVPHLSGRLLRNLVEYADVHCYAPPGVVVEANSDYLLIHHEGKEEREIEVTLPAPCNLRAVYGIGNQTNTKAFKLTLPKGSFTELYERSIP